MEPDATRRRGGALGMNHESTTETSSAIEPSSTGLEPRLAALLSYLVGFLTGILFLVIEKRSRFVRFHAMQSTITFLGLFVVHAIAMVIPLLGILLQFLVSILSLALWVFLMVKAFQGEYFKLPVVGDLAEERTNVPGP
jgi:uncharacterized membrane protein